MNTKDITKTISPFADEFASYTFSEDVCFDFTLRSLDDIDALLPMLESKKNKSGITNEVCQLESKMLAYIIKTICITYNARCIGVFDPSECLLGHYYNLEIDFSGQYFNVTNGLLRAIRGQFSFGDFCRKYIPVNKSNSS